MTYASRLAAHFQAKPNQWLNGLELAQIAGAYAWRSRIADLRKPRFNMVIENRQRRLPNGVIVSEYKYVPPASSLLDIAEREQVSA